MSEQFDDFVYEVEHKGTGEGPTIDFDGLTKYVIEAVGCEKKPSGQIGIISQIVEVGKQRQEDAKMKWNGTPEEEAAEIAKNPNQYFEDLEDPKTKQVSRYKRWPVDAQESVIVFFDVPSKLVNRGKFFDEDGVGEDLPFRGLLNNEYFTKGVGKTVSKTYSLKESKNPDGTWSLRSNSILHKLAEAVEVLDEKGNMKPQYLGKLIGKAALFNVHVFGNEYDGKTYLNEKMSFAGPVPEMMQSMIPTLDRKHMALIRFKGPQNLEKLKELRQSVINTMMLADNFIGSDIEKGLIEVGKIKEGDAAAAQKAAFGEGGASAPQPQQAPKAQPAKPAPKAAPQEPVDFDSFDDDIPFAPIGLQEGRNFLHMI